MLHITHIIQKQLNAIIILAFVCIATQSYGQDTLAGNYPLLTIKSGSHVIKNVVTVKGQSPFMHEPNDGVVTIHSQKHHADMELVEVDYNHYEVVLSDKIVNIIQERTNKFKK
jgi:hypothetical protein